MYYRCKHIHIIAFSVFDGNIAADGSAINIAYYSARFENVTFSRNKESAVRVSYIESVCMQSTDKIACTV